MPCKARPPVHGTIYCAVKYNCPCAPCRQCKSQYSRRSREKIATTEGRTLGRRLKKGVVLCVHGSTTRYRKWGCRCSQCVCAWQAYQKQWATAKRRKCGIPKRGTLPPPPHGTANRYTNHGCRCRSCRRAGTVYANQGYARREAKRTEQQWRIKVIDRHISKQLRENPEWQKGIETYRQAKLLLYRPQPKQRKYRRLVDEVSPQPNMASTPPKTSRK